MTLSPLHVVVNWLVFTIYCMLGVLLLDFDEAYRLCDICSNRPHHLMTCRLILSEPMEGYSKKKIFGASRRNLCPSTFKLL